MNGVVEIFVGLLLAVAVLALLARKLHIPYPILFVIGGLLLGWIPGLPKVEAQSRTGFSFLSAAAFVSGGAVHFVARFPLEPPSHFAARHRAGFVHHDGRRVSRALFHAPAARRRICPGRDHFAAGRHRGHGDCRTPENSAPHRHDFGRRKSGQRRDRARRLSFCGGGRGQRFVFTGARGRAIFHRGHRRNSDRPGRRLAGAAISQARG